MREGLRVLSANTNAAAALANHQATSAGLHKRVSRINDAGRHTDIHMAKAPPTQDGLSRSGSHGMHGTRGKSNIHPEGLQMTIRKGTWGRIRKTELFDVDNTCRRILSGTGSGGRPSANYFEKWGGRQVRVDLNIRGVIQTVSVRRSQRVVKRLTYK